MRKLICLPLFLATLFCQAQKEMLKGNIVLQTGDTLCAMINENSLKKAESVIEAVSGTGEDLHFTPDQIKSVVLEDGGTYRSWEVSFEISYIDGLNFDVKHEDSTTRAVLLLEKIYTGLKLDLYYCQTKTKEYFFVCANDKIESFVLKY
jgi:hypothetical protein